MTDGRYERRAECEAIEKVHNKHHCYVPPEVWGISAETVCQVCQLKNQRLFVEVALELAVDAPLPKRIPEAVRPPVLILKEPQLGAVVKERMCSDCGNTQIWRALWKKGARLCGACRIKTKERTCRFCGRHNITPQAFSREHQRCSRKACWVEFLKELQLKKAG